MLTLTVNGTARRFDDGTTLAELLLEVAGSTRGSAAAVDGEVVPRGDWASYMLRTGAHIEVITAVQGG